MSGVLQLLQPVAEWLGFDKYRINSLIFSLNTKLTLVILLTFTFILASVQFIGDPIDCIVEEIPSGNAGVKLIV